MSADTKNIVEAISASVQCITALALAIIAILGFRMWRWQLIGEKRYEAVRRLLVLARQFQADFSRARGVATFANEYKDRPHGTDETPEKARILDEQYARQARLQPAADVLPELQQAVWEAEIITGEQISPLVKPFVEVVLELDKAILLHFSAHSLMSELPPGRPVSPVYSAQDKTALLYAHKPDELNERVDKALEALEQKLRKYIH